MRNRRALSTVVGAVFFIIATTTVITYITYSMNTIDNFSQSIIVSESQNIDRGREEITISQVTIDSGKFNVTVTNTGSLPVHLTRLWVTNQDGVTGDQKADLDINLNPGQQEIKIGQYAGISADYTANYNLKVITERGNISTFQVSPQMSTRIQVISPGTVNPTVDFKVVSLITNNSTTPGNIANLVPTLTSNVTLTKISGPTPSSISSLPQGSTAAFTWTYKSPVTVGGIWFNASYTDAPQGSFVFSNVSNILSSEAQMATSSQWSQAASRVGILISGVPNPIESGGGGSQKWGIGIINPLDRPVDVYAVSISTPGKDFLNLPVAGFEPLGTQWRLSTNGDNIVLWEGGAIPRVIPAKSVAQFRVTSEASSIGAAPAELFATIQALTSEGKLSVIYPVTTKSTFSTMNVFYSSDPLNPLTSWGYLIQNIPSGKTGQVFNATVQNSSIDPMTAYVKLIILVPADFKMVESYGVNTGWGDALISSNPDGSTVIAVQTSSKPFDTGAKTYQFQANIPSVSDTKLYVFQTTSVYIDWTLSDAVQTASALSEAGVQVIP